MFQIHFPILIMHINKHQLKAVVLGLALLAAPMGVRDASAQGVYFTKTTVLKSFFAQSKRVTYERFTLSDVQMRRLTKRLGYAPPRQVVVYMGVTDGRVDGYAVIDNQAGQHEPITFAALVGVDGGMERFEVMVYREGHGEEVRQARFRRQFIDKTAADPVRHGRDIVAVSGATISSRAMAIAARRVLVLVDELITGRTDQATAGQPGR